MKRWTRTTLFIGKENLAEAKKLLSEQTNSLDETSVLVMKRGDPASSISFTWETKINKFGCNEVFDSSV